MKIRKFSGISPDDSHAIAKTFSEVEFQKIAYCNWSDKYPYSPEVYFQLFHTGKWLMVRFEVFEKYTAALVTQDNGNVWNDSCVEFFIALDDEIYYNFEVSCIGVLLLGARKSREKFELAPRELVSIIKRSTTFPFGKPFRERLGNNHWSLTLSIPPQTLFKHNLTDWSGLSERANFYKCGDKLTQPHFLSWCPIKTLDPNFHRPDFFGWIQFAY